MNDDQPGMFPRDDLAHGCGTVLALMFVAAVMLFLIALGVLFLIRVVAP